MAKIIKITEYQILFSDGSKIEFDHEQDCCEHNYADFEQLDDLARAHNFNTSKMLFEKSGDHGFIFGDNRRTFFVPCYSVQNGYYTTAVDIYFNGKCVLGLNGEFVYG